MKNFLTNLKEQLKYIYCFLTDRCYYCGSKDLDDGGGYRTRCNTCKRDLE